MEEDRGCADVDRFRRPLATWRTATFSYKWCLSSHYFLSLFIQLIAHKRVAELWFLFLVSRGTLKEAQANPSVALALVDDMFLFVRGEGLLLLGASQQDLWGPRQGRTLSCGECFENKNTKSTLGPEYLGLVFMAAACSEILGVKPTWTCCQCTIHAIPNHTDQLEYNAGRSQLCLNKNTTSHRKMSSPTSWGISFNSVHDIWLVVSFWTVSVMRNSRKGHFGVPQWPLVEWCSSLYRAEECLPVISTHRF